MSVLYITHDLGVVSKVADRVCVMYAGIIAEQGNRHDIFKNPKHPYTQALPGTVPNPAYKPGGCPFHPRCQHAIQTCREQYPEMCEYGDEHHARCPVLFEGSGGNGGE
jgi:peptide/nickel transport system ATP-binding protein/oligopeptide transport system ATP-binding protein